MLQSASEINSSNDDKMGKRPRSHYSELNTTSNSGGKLDTSFESYFGVERSASNSDVVRIRVPYSRDDALNQMKKATSTQDNTDTTPNTDQNKIRISVPQNSSNGNNKLEDTFNAKLVMKNHLHNHTNSNSKSMTNL